MTDEKKQELKEKREEAQKWLRLGRADFAFLILEAINNGASISSIRGLATDEMAGVEVRTCQASDIVIPDRCTADGLALIRHTDPVCQSWIDGAKANGCKDRPKRLADLVYGKKT